MLNYKQNVESKFNYYLEKNEFSKTISIFDSISRDETI